VKQAAAAAGVPVLQPDKLKDEVFLAALHALDADAGVVAAYGKILPAAVLAAPRLGLINVHASLLPRHRGAAPVHRAVMAGDVETGVSIMRVVQALDAGGVFATGTRPIAPTTRAPRWNATSLASAPRSLSRSSTPLPPERPSRCPRMTRWPRMRIAFARRRA